MKESEKQEAGRSGVRIDDAGKRERYEPPMAEEIDTLHGPGETAALVANSTPRGVEESGRWH